MGVYSIMRSDADIINAVKSARRLAIICCEGCANESLAYDKNIPLKMKSGQHVGQDVLAPNAVLEEALRLKAILQTEANEIIIASGVPLCSILSDGKGNDLEWLKPCNGADTAIILSCAAGILGVKSTLGKAVKIVPGMKTIGIHFSYKTIDHSTGNAHIDRERSAFLRLFEEKGKNDFE